MSLKGTATACVLGLGLIGVPAVEARAKSHSEMPRHEFLINASEGGLNRVGFGGGTELGLGGIYAYRALSFLQVGARVSVVYKGVSASNGVTVSLTTFSFAAGATLNFPFDWDLRDAFFGGIYLGIAHASIAGVSTTPFIFVFPVGKRFQVFPNVSYTPSFELLVPTSGNVAGLFKLLQVSILF